ncbi:MAG TPA: hypothetical protein VGB15_21305 [Longimicrobium sp.]
MPLSQPHVTAASPPFPEAALRAVLAGTVAAWADLPSAEDEPRRLYLDAFAGAEFQFGTGVERAADEETRAGAAIRALDSAGAAPPVALFVEEDPAHLGRIYAELEDTAGGERLRATRDLASLAAGEVSLIEMPFTTVAADVARFAAGARTFAFLAPPAARALPWDALRQIAAMSEATVLIRLPHSDFEKQGRHTGPLADLPGFARRIVEGCSAMLDDPRHAWLPAWRADAASGQAAAMTGVLERFRTLLDGVAGGRVLQPMDLETRAGARTWLFLLTPDPAVIHGANAAVRAAKLIDRAPAAAPLRATTEAAVDQPSAAPPSTDAVAEPVASSTAESPDSGAAPPRRKGRRASKSPDPAPSPAVPAPQASDPLSDVAVPEAPASSAANASVGSESPTDAAAPDAAEAPVRTAAPSAANAPGEAAPCDVDPSGGAESPAPRVAPEEPEPSSSAAAPGPADAPAPARARPPAKPPAKPVAEVLDLFAEDVATSAVPEYVLPTRPDPAVLAADLEARFAGTTVAWSEILRAFPAADATPAELKTALALLRRGGRAAYKALKAADDAVEFPAEPVLREKPKRRRKVEDDAGLFGGGEEGGEEEGGGAGGKGD